jgi:hypothetical protein
MNVLRKAVGILLIPTGIALGIWIDIFVLLIGGINETVVGFDAHPHNGHEIAWGLVKAIVFTGTGVIVAIIVIICGAVLIGWRRKPSRRNRSRSRI